jgi:ATP-dependent DNA helicase DinG
MADASPGFLVPGTDPDVAAAYAALADRAREESFGFEDEIAFVDIETTGFDPRHSSIIEVAAVIARGPDVLERFTVLVDPGCPIPRETTHLTGITDDMVVGSPGVDEAVERLADAVGGRDIVAHNVGFDRSFLQVAGSASGVTFEGAWLDSLELARIALPRMRSHRLADLAAAFGLVAAEHRALPDAEAVFGLWRIALCALADLPAEVLTTASTLDGGDWSLRPLLAHLAAARPSAGADLALLRRSRVAKRQRIELPDAREVELDGPDTDDVASEFGADGAVARMYETYETRNEQVRMSRAVADALEQGRHLSIEAGTGVGKSVAYLVPAIRFACANGVTVGVSTKTNALMDQLVHTELPALSRELREEFEFVALKGYGHYPCLRKLDRYVRGDDGDERSPATAATLLSWVAQTSWGDVDGLNLHWSTELRARVTAHAEECTKKRCRYFPDLCFLHGVRRRAGCANIVVTNHALLFSNVMVDGGILPPVRHWVIDEAHSAEEVAREQLSVRVDRQGLTTLLRGLAARKGGPLAGLSALADEEIGDEERALAARAAADAARGEADTALTIAQSFFEYVKELPDTDSAYDRSEMRITERTRESGIWGRIASTGSSLARHLTVLLESGTVLLSLLEEEDIRATDDRADFTGLLTALAEQVLGLRAVIDGENEDLVYSVTADRRPDVAIERLDARVIDVGDVLAERFFPEMRTVTFTSATIAVGDDFSHFERSLGLDRAGAPRDVVRLASSYDFERQMAAFVTADAPDPRSSDYLDGMGDLLFDLHVAMGGSTLTLFTNRRDLAALYEDVGARLEAEGLRLVGQVRGESTKRIRDEFITDERASLFATKSFWEGFDAKGDTLRCVVVVRLPFAHPGDPLLEELKERDPDRWWSDHYLPRAVLELKQAAGRLIRSSTDEGCLVLADSRVVTRPSYGRTFLQALPVSSVRVAATGDVAEEIARRFGRPS